MKKLTQIITLLTDIKRELVSFSDLALEVKQAQTKTNSLLTSIEKNTRASKALVPSRPKTQPTDK